MWEIMIKMWICSFKGNDNDNFSYLMMIWTISKMYKCYSVKAWRVISFAQHLVLIIFEALKFDFKYSLHVCISIAQLMVHVEFFWNFFNSNIHIYSCYLCLSRHCLLRVREETKEIQDKMFVELDQVGVLPDKENVILYEGETLPETDTDKRPVEIKKKRPFWFSKDLTGPSSKW